MLWPVTDIILGGPLLCPTGKLYFLGEHYVIHLRKGMYSINVVRRTVR